MPCEGCGSEAKSWPVETTEKPPPPPPPRIPWDLIAIAVGGVSGGMVVGYFIQESEKW